MILLNTHVWVNWILLGEPGLTKPVIATAITHDAMLASLDSVFPAYPELSGRLIAR